MISLANCFHTIFFISSIIFDLLEVNAVTTLTTVNEMNQFFTSQAMSELITIQLMSKGGYCDVNHITQVLVYLYKYGWVYYL